MIASMYYVKACRYRALDHSNGEKSTRVKDMRKSYWFRDTVLFNDVANQRRLDTTTATGKLLMQN